MELNHLHTFNHAAKHLNFTRTSEELNISQPAVSRHIDALEQDLNVKLFHRIGRSIKLTDAGTTLLTFSEQILSLVKKASDAMLSINSLESGTLSVGASTTIGNYFLAPVVMKFIEQYPGIHVKVDIRSSQEILERLENNVLDIAILPESMTSATLTSENILMDKIVLVVPNNHKLLSKDNIVLEDLQNEMFLIRGKGSNTRQIIEQLFNKHGIRLPTTVEFNSNESIKQAIMSGAGISFLSLRTIQLELKASILRYIQCDQVQITRQFCIMQHNESYPTPAIQAFREFIKRVASEVETRIRDYTS